jgi:phosphoribosylglycinamide formyltransferase
MDNPIRLTVLISGNGSNLQAVIDNIDAGQRLSATIVRVLSNRKDAYGLERAKRAGIPTTYYNLLGYKKRHDNTPEGTKAAREEYDADLAALVLQDTPNLVTCLGFMHVLSAKFLQPLWDAGVKIINLHPALPGAFNGAVSLNFLFFSFLPIVVYHHVRHSTETNPNRLHTKERPRAGPRRMDGGRDR